MRPSERSLMAATGFLYGTFGHLELFGFQEGLEHQIVGARYRSIIQLAWRCFDLRNQFLDT